MNSDNEPADMELLKRYRRVSDAAPSRPNDAVRSAILAEGRRAAAQNAALAPHQFDTQAPAANRPRWRYAAIGTACAAALAGFLVVPQFLMQPRQEAVVSVSVPTASPSATEPVAADNIAPASAPEPKTETAAAAPARDLRKGPSALVQIPHERAKLSRSAPAVAELPKAPPAPAIQGSEDDRDAFIAGSRKPAAEETPRQMTRQLSSDLKQVTVAPDAAPAAAPPVPETPPRTAGYVPPPRDDRAREASAGAPASNDLEEIILTGAKAQHPVPTPLISAVNWGRAGKAAALLESGEGSVAETDSKGRTPLLRAVERKRLDLVQLLLAHGADPNLPDAAGDTPLSIARQKKLTDIVAALEAAAKPPP